MQTTDYKTYSLVSPSLTGILSDDDLYFEGVSRPPAYYSIHDTPTSRDPVILERYWNDVYNLFLRKLSFFAGDSTAVDEESVKLQALLQELIKVKSLLSAKDELKT